MHLRQYEEVAEAQNREELTARLTAFTWLVDFERFSLVLQQPRRDGSKTYRGVTNAPSAWLTKHRDNALALKDPVHTHLRHSFKPILYSQRTYVDAGVGEMWEEQAPFGYQVGVAVSLAMPGGARMLLGVDRPGSLPNDPDKVARVVSDLQLLATYTQDTVLRVVAANDDLLTAQQLNVLQLIAEGKSTSVIATLLGVSENTVKFHVAGIFKRLRVATREQAVREACRIGLIS